MAKKTTPKMDENERAATTKGKQLDPKSHPVEGKEFKVKNEAPGGKPKGKRGM